MLENLNNFSTRIQYMVRPLRCKQVKFEYIPLAVYENNSLQFSLNKNIEMWKKKNELGASKENYNILFLVRTVREEAQN